MRFIMNVPTVYFSDVPGARARVRASGGAQPACGLSGAIAGHSSFQVRILAAERVATILTTVMCAGAITGVRVCVCVYVCVWGGGGAPQ